MPSFNAGSIEATAALDRSEFTRELQQMKADVERATADPATMRVTLDDSDAKRKFDQLKATLAAAQGPTIKVNLDTGDAKAQLDALKAQLAGTTGGNVRLNVELAGSASVLSELARLDEAVGRLDGRDINIRVNVGNAAANSALADTAARAAALGSLSPTITPNVNPGPATTGLGSVQGSAMQAGSAMDALIGIAVLVAPALVPIGVAALGASAGLVSMATAGGAAVGIFGGAVLGAVKATLSNAKALDTSNTALASAKTAYQGAADAAQSAAQGVASAKDAVTAAQQAVGQAAQQAAQAVQNAKDQVVTAFQQQAAAQQSVQNAEQSLTNAQNAARDAQLALTQARVDATRSIEDMNASLADAQLSERGAKLAVEQAQLALNQANAAGSKATELQRQQAQLAFDEAKQHLTEQETQTARLTTDTAAANAAGVAGSKQVTAANKQVQSSQQGVTTAAQQLASAQQSASNANIAVAKAQQAVQQAQVNGAQAVQKAQNSVAKAQQGVITAQNSAARSAQAAATAAAALAAAQNKQSLAAKAFSPIERVLSASFDNLKSKWAGFIGATEKQTLAPVVTVVNALAGALPRLIPVVSAMAPLAKGLANSFAAWVGGAGLKRATDFIITFGVPIVGHFISILKNLLTTGGNLVRTFAPMGVSIAAALDRGSTAMAKWSNTGFERFLQKVQQVWPSVKAALAALGGALRQIGAAVAGLGPAAILTFTGMLRVIAALPIPVLQALILAFGAFKLLSGAVAGARAVTNLAGSLRLAAAAQWAWNVAQMASPTTWIILGIVALIAAIVLIATKTTWFQTAWKYTWNAIKQVASDVWNWLHSGFGALIALIGPVGWIIAIATHWQQVWGAIQAVAQSVWDWLKSAFGAVTKFFSDRLSAQADFWKNTWNSAWGWIKNVGQSVWNAIRAAFQAFTGWVSNVWSSALHGLQTGAQAVWSGILGAVHAFGSGFQSALSGIAKAAGVIWNGLKKILAVPINFLIQSVYQNGIKKIWDNTAGKIGLPSMPAAPAPLKFATGGQVPGVGVGDHVRALLTPGERVLSRDNVAALGGHDVLDRAFGRQFGRTENGVVHADFGWGSIVDAAKNIGGDVLGAGKAAFNAGKGAVGWGLDKIHQLAADVVYDIAKPALGLLKSAVNSAAPKSPKAAHDIPVNATGKLVDGALAFLKGQQDSAKAAESAGSGTSDPGEILKYAIQISQGKPYVWGGTGPDGFDCSGLVQTAYKHFGIDTTRTSESQYAAATPETAAQALPGDLVFENFPGEVSPGHVGFFAGPGKIWNANSPGAGIRYDNIQNLVGYGYFTRDKKLIGSNTPASSVGGNVKSWIAAAEKAAGVSGDAWTNGIATIISRESGGNPNAVNNTDSNAAAGTPSKGLMQVIQPTFDTYHVAGTSNNLLDPVANIAAAIRYIIATYGDISNVQQANPNMSPKGYAGGTLGAAPGWAWVGEQGPELMRMGGGEQVMPHGISMAMTGGYAGGTLASSIGKKLTAATKTTTSDQSKVNSLQNSYDQVRLDAAYAKTAKERAAAAAEQKVLSLRLSIAKHQLAQAKQSEAQLKSDYAAATKSVTAASKATAATFTSWLNAQKTTMADQLKAAQDMHDSYLSSAQGAAPSLSGLNTYTAIAGAFGKSTTNLKNLTYNIGMLKSRGVSPGLLNAILAMSPGDALNYTNGLMRLDTNGVAAADSAFAGYDTASQEFATANANITANYSGLSAASKALGTVTVKTEYPTKVTIVDPHGNLITGTIKAVETKVQSEIQQLVKSATTSKR